MVSVLECTIKHSADSLAAFLLSCIMACGLPTAQVCSALIHLSQDSRGLNGSAETTSTQSGELSRGTLGLAWSM